MQSVLAFLGYAEEIRRAVRPETERALETLKFQQEIPSGKPDYNQDGINDRDVIWQASLAGRLPSGMDYWISSALRRPEFARLDAFQLKSAILVWTHVIAFLVAAGLMLGAVWASNPS